MKIDEILTEEEVRLDPKCWKGKKIGNPKTKMKGGVRVNNCVPAEESVNESVTKKPQPYNEKDWTKKLPKEKLDALAGQKTKKGQKPNTESLSLEEQFDAIEEMINQIAEDLDVDAEVLWENLESVSDDELSAICEDWQKVNKRDKTDGMSRKAVKAYRREHPGSKLKTAVTTKPSKLKKGSKSAKRRKSFCARMSGMKKAHASAKTKRDPNSPINKALRRWNC